MRRLVDRAMLALTVALAGAGLAVILTQSPASRLSSDFTINYSAGVLVRQGHLAAPYHQGELGAVMQRVAPDGAIDPRLPFSLPLAAALPYALLSLLPLELAFRVCQLLSAALMLIALLLLQRGAPTLPSPNVSNARMALKRRSRGPTGPPQAEEGNRHGEGDTRAGREIYNRLQFLPCACTHPRGPHGPDRRRRAGASRW